MARRPLFVACAAFAAGAFVGIGLDRSAALSLALLLGVASLAAHAVGRRALARVPGAGQPVVGSGEPLAGAGVQLALLLGLAASLGLLRAAAAPRSALDEPLRSWPHAASAQAGREPLLVEAVVISAEPARDGTRLLLQLESRETAPGEPLFAAPPGLRALVFGPAGLHRGDRVRALARLHRPPAALNPGGRDERAELALRGIALQGSLDEPGLAVLSRGPSWQRKLDELRARFASRCADLCTSADRGALVAALGVGDRSRIRPALDDELARSGLIHLLASPGLHLAVLALLARTLSRWLSLRFRRTAPHATALAALCALPVVAAEVLLLGSPWPAVRAGAGAGLILLAPLCARRSDALTALGAAAALCALVDPACTHELALQLSLAGVLGLLLLAPRLHELFPLAPLHPGAPRRLRWLLHHVAALACATCAATLFTAPLVAAAFHRVSLISVAANAVALWPGLVAIPLAALAAPLDALCPPLALPLLWAADGLAGLTLEAAHLFAAIPGAALRVAAPSVPVALLWAILLAQLSCIPGPVGRRPEPSRARPRTRLLRASVPLALLALLGGVRAARPALSENLTATFFAVGQGDAALVRFPGGSTLLIDSGGDLRGLPAPLGPGRLDPGARDLLPALAELGVSRIDRAVLTHPHPDHAGGLPALLEAIPIGELWLTGEPGPGSLGETIRALASARGVPIRVPRAGEVLQVENARGARIEVLHPDRAWDPQRNTNDNSIVLRVVHGEVALLFAGDVEALAEAQLAQGPRPLAAQLLKAPHHGSRTSSTDAFLRAVHPEAVVYSAGRGNLFGFPHPEVVARARALGAVTFSTEGGAIEATSDGRSLSIKPLFEDPG